MTQNEALMNGQVPYHHHQHYTNSYFHVSFSGFSPIALSDVHGHPLCCVGAYALIRFATAAVSVLSTAIQRSVEVYVYFHKPLTIGVCTTMHWHLVPSWPRAQ
jgi:hypothetical protein